MILNILLTALTAYLLADCVVQYHRAIGSVWQRLIAAGRGSITVLWQRIVMVATGLISGLVWIADALNEPMLSQAVTTYLRPNVVAIIMVGSALVTVWARKRKMTV